MGKTFCLYNVKNQVLEMDFDSLDDAIANAKKRQSEDAYGDFEVWEKRRRYYSEVVFKEEVYSGFSYQELKEKDRSLEDSVRWNVEENDNVKLVDCVQCHKPFAPKTGNQKLCDYECRNKYNKMRDMRIRQIRKAAKKEGGL